MKTKSCTAGFLLLILSAGLHLHAQQIDTNSGEGIKAQVEKGEAQSGQSFDSMKKRQEDVKPVSPSPAPAQEQTILPELTQEDIEWLRQKGIDPSTVTEVHHKESSRVKQPSASATPTDLKGAVVWLDNFLGATNAMIAADVISMKPEALKFRLFEKDYNYSGHYTVILSTPRQHKNSYFGLGAPETANLIILENAGGHSWPLQNGTIWEKGNGFIVVVALDKEWIHSGTYTIQK